MDRRSFFLRTIGGLLTAGWMSLEKIVAAPAAAAAVDEAVRESLRPPEQHRRIERVYRKNPNLDLVSSSVRIHCSQCKKIVPEAWWRYDQRTDTYHVRAKCHGDSQLFSFFGSELFSADAAYALRPRNVGMS